MLFGRRNKPSWREKLRNAVWPRRGIARPFVYLAKRLPRLSATPHAIAAGFASGAAGSFTPFLGFHFMISFGLAYAVRGNMIAAAFGTAVGNPLTFPLMFAATYEVGSIILSFFTNQVPNEQMMEQQSEALMNEGLFSMGFERLWPLLKTMSIGAVPLGLLAFIFFYVGVRMIIGGVQRSRQKRLARREAANEAAALENDREQIRATGIAIPSRSSALHEPHHKQQHHGPDRRMQERCEEPAPGGKAELREQVSGDHGTEDAEHHVSDQPEASPAYQLTGDPAGKRADDEEYDQTADTHEEAPLSHLNRRQRLKIR